MKILDEETNVVHPKQTQCPAQDPYLDVQHNLSKNGEAAQEPCQTADPPGPGVVGKGRQGKNVEGWVDFHGCEMWFFQQRGRFDPQDWPPARESGSDMLWSLVQSMPGNVGEEDEGHAFVDFHLLEATRWGLIRDRLPEKFIFVIFNYRF